MATLSLSDLPNTLLMPQRFSTSDLKSLPSHKVTVVIYPSSLIPQSLPDLLLPFVNRAYNSELFPKPNARFDDTDDYLQELRSNGDLAWVFVVFVHAADEIIPLDLAGIDVEAASRPRGKVTEGDKIRLAATSILKIGSENPDEPKSPDLLSAGKKNIPPFSPDEDTAAAAATTIQTSHDPFHELFLQGLSVDKDLHGHGLGSFVMKEMERFIMHNLPLPKEANGRTTTAGVTRNLYAHTIREVGSNEAFYMKRGYVLKSVHKFSKGTWDSVGDFHVIAAVKKVLIIGDLSISSA